MKITCEGYFLDTFKSVKEEKTSQYINVLCDGDIIVMRVNPQYDMPNVPPMSKCTFDVTMRKFNDNYYFTVDELAIDSYAEYKKA